MVFIFSEITLEPEEECSYLIFTGITEDIQEIRNLSKTYTTREKVLEELEKQKHTGRKSKCCLSYRRFRFQPVYALGKLSANSASYLWLFLPSAS